jgi:hypothetical protein
MKSINAEILLRNRQVFVKGRDDAFREAGRLVDEILELYGENGTEYFDPGQLEDLMVRLVDRLYHARYYARLSAGGNNASPPAEIDHAEQAHIDHIEAMYSYARSIYRCARHEMLIDSFVRDHPEVSENFKTYLAEIRKSDANLIYINLCSLRKRMRTYHRFMDYPRAPRGRGSSRAAAAFSKEEK